MIKIWMFVSLLVDQRNQKADSNGESSILQTYCIDFNRAHRFLPILIGHYHFYYLLSICYFILA